MNRVRGAKAWTHRVLEVAADGDRISLAVDITLTVLIILNVVAAILQTVETLYEGFRPWFDGFEIISVAIFFAEYLARVWSCTVNPRYKSPVAGRIRYVLSPMAMIDLLAIAPFFLSSIIVLDLRMLRAIRLVRLVRILKIARYSESIQLLGRVIWTRRGELTVTLMAVTVMLVISSTLMYYTENDVQPEKFSSIPATMWWGVATLTTVGYGDIYPVSPLGRILGAGIAILGIGLFALPAGILGSAFVDELQQRRKQAMQKCPECGHEYHESPGR